MATNSYGRSTVGASNNNDSAANNNMNPEDYLEK